MRDITGFLQKNAEGFTCLYFELGIYSPYGNTVIGKPYHLCKSSPL
jgi:hypothetical protein